VKITQPLVVRTMMSLQKAIGNAQVQRLIAALEHSRSSRLPPSIQRYAVPGNLPCSDVVAWLDTNSPYLPHGWARTDTNHTFNGRATVTTRHLESGDWEAHAQGHARLGVSTTNSVHMPTWVPSARPDQAGEVAAWNAMVATLRAHENQHRAIGTRWHGTLETNWKGLDETATGSTRAAARAALVQQIQADQAQWQAAHQADQDAIDPPSPAPTLTCP
jgi:hypothetical protein